MREIVPLGRGRRERDDRLAALRQRRAADEVHLPADARVDPVADRVGADLPGEVDLEGRVDRHDARRLLPDERRVVGAVARVELDQRVVVHEVEQAAACPITKLRHGAVRVHLLVRLVIDAASTRSTRPSENISVWTPRSSLSPRRRSTASGMRADAHLQRRAVLDQLGDELADGGLDLGLRRGRVLVQRAVGVRDSASIRLNGTTTLPCVRGIWSLISAMISVADVRRGAVAASTDVPSVQNPWRSGGDSCSNATSSWTCPERKSPGMSERKIGTKSARPSSIASRRGAPVKSETDRNRPSCSGAANGAGPAVCRW